jgi:hypothetical protein
MLNGGYVMKGLKHTPLKGMPMGRMILGICLLVIACLLVGCEPDKTYGELREEIWLSPFDIWQLRIHWVFNATERNLVFPDIRSSIEKRCQSANEWGIRCWYKQQETLEGGVIVGINAVGSGLQSLNIAAFDGKALLVRDEKGYVLLEVSPPVERLRYYGLTLHSGPIAESNANQQTKFTAIWKNPQVVRIKTLNWNPLGLILIVFTIYPLFTYGGLIALIVLIVLGVLLHKRRY